MGNSASGLPYSIGKEVGVGPVDGGWLFHEGNRKSDGEVVSVFVGKKAVMVKTAIAPLRDKGKMQLIPAYHQYQNCKKLRHPYILRVLATLDTDNPDDNKTEQQQQQNNGSVGSAPSDTKGDLIIVTEACTPLEVWLQNNNPSKNELVWGLECIVRALSFLHTSANLSHGNLSPSSFYVTKSGDIKLWNFHLVMNHAKSSDAEQKYFKEWEDILTPGTYRSPERVERRYDALFANGTGVHVLDSYGLGILIDYMFSGQIPQQLQKAVQRLQTPNIRMRPRLQPLLKCPIFENPLSKVQLQLSELNVQPVEQKIAFWQNFYTTHFTSNSHGSIIKSSLAVYKILPEIQTTIISICQNDSMLSQDLYRREVLSVISPLFYIAETYLSVLPSDTEDQKKKKQKEFDRIMKPLVEKLFKVQDRAIRGIMLSKISFLSTQFQHDKTVLNNKVFEPLCSGFSDSSSALRELSLKVTITLVPHLTPPNIEKLTRYLIRLQNDTEPSIRTNTIIFIGKLAPNLTEVSRQKLILPAFVRSTKDPFTPCRLAALQSLTMANPYFDSQQLAGRVLPAITPMLLDPVRDVRHRAFDVVDQVMKQLREVSSNMGDEQQQQQNGTANTKATVPAPPTSGNSTGGYLSSKFSSWMSSSTAATDNANDNNTNSVQQQQPVPTQPPLSTVMPKTINTTTTASNAVSSKFSKLTMNGSSFSNNNDDGVNAAADGWGDDDDGIGDDENEGWGDDFDDDNNNNNVMNSLQTFNNKPMTTQNTTTAMMMKGISDDPFAMLGAGTTVSTGSKLGTSKLVVPKTKATITPSTKPAVTKLLIADDDDNDGWGDDDGWDDI